VDAFSSNLTYILFKQRLLWTNKLSEKQSNSRLILSNNQLSSQKLAIFPVLIQEMELIRKKVLLEKLFRRGF
jgi:hypothetical protein